MSAGGSILGWGVEVVSLLDFVGGVSWVVSSCLVVLFFDCAYSGLSFVACRGPRHCENLLLMVIIGHGLLEILVQSFSLLLVHQFPKYIPRLPFDRSLMVSIRVCDHHIDKNLLIFITYDVYVFIVTVKPIKHVKFVN